MTCSGARATAGSATAASRLAVNWPSRSASGSDACTNTRSPSAAGTRNGSIPTGGNRPPAQVCRRQHEPIPRRRRGQATDAAEPPPTPVRTHPCQNRCGAAFGIGVRPPPHLQHGLGDRQFAQGLGVAQHIAPVRAAQAQCPARREFAKERSEQIDGGWLGGLLRRLRPCRGAGGQWPAPPRQTGRAAAWLGFLDHEQSQAGLRGSSGNESAMLVTRHLGLGTA